MVESEAVTDETPTLILEADQPKVTIPAPVQSKIREMYGKIRETYQAAADAELAFQKARLAAQLARETFGQYVATAKKVLKANKSWDMDAEANYFFEWREGQPRLLPDDLKAVDVPEGAQLDVELQQGTGS